MKLGYFDNMGYAIAAYFIIYLCGHLVYGLISTDTKSSAFSEFKKNVLGGWVLIGLYSVSKTGGITVNLGFLVLGLIYWWKNKPRITGNFTIDLRAVGVQLLLLGIIYTILYFSLFGWEQREYYWMLTDLPTYATFADKLNVIGAEGIAGDFLYKEPIRQLYHFGDIWYVAFFSWLFKHNTLQILYFTVFANGLMSVVVGAKAVIEHFSSRAHPVQWPFAFGIIAMSGITLIYPKSVPFFNLTWGDGTLRLNIKYFFVAQQVIWSLLTLRSRRFDNAIMLMLVAVMLNNVAAPSILMGSVFFIATLLLIKEINFRHALQLVLPVLSMAFFVLFFSIWITQLNRQLSESLLTSVAQFNFSENLRSFTYYQTAFNCTAGTMIRFFLSFLPFALLLLLPGHFKAFRNSKLEYVFFLTFCFASAIAYGIFHTNHDGTQPWTTLYIPLVAVLPYVIIMNALTSEKKLAATIFSSILIVLVLYQNLLFNDSSMLFKQYRSFESQLLYHIPKDHKKEIGVFYPKREPTGPFGVNTNIYHPFNYIQLYVNNYHPFTLSVLDTIMSKDPYLRNFQLFTMSNSALYKFVNKEKMSGSYISQDSSLVRFVRAVEIKYILTVYGARLPEVLLPYVSNTVTDTSAISKAEGHKLYILRDM